MQLFYHPHLDESQEEIVFDKEESRHIQKVLRKSKGDFIAITNGKGLMVQAQITDSDFKKCKAEVIEKKFQTPLPYTLHLAVAPTKLNDRYEWFLEKATEIGVSEITPVICSHSERKVIKAGRMEKIIQSAMKQSLKAFLPKLNESISFKEFIHSNHSNYDHKFIAHCEESEKSSLKSQLPAGENILIAIGPEGDFSSDEIKEAKKAGFIPVTLGESRLRTETAAIVACHSVAFVNENH